MCSVFTKTSFNGIMLLSEIWMYKVWRRASCYWAAAHYLSLLKAANPKSRYLTTWEWDFNWNPWRPERPWTQQNVMLINLSIIFSTSQSVFFVYKLWQWWKNVDRCFPKPSVTSSNVFSCPYPKYVQFTVTEKYSKHKAVNTLIYLIVHNCLKKSVICKILNC